MKPVSLENKMNPNNEKNLKIYWLMKRNLLTNVKTSLWNLKLNPHKSLNFPSIYWFVILKMAKVDEKIIKYFVKRYYKEYKNWFEKFLRVVEG